MITDHQIRDPCKETFLLNESDGCQIKRNNEVNLENQCRKSHVANLKTKTCRVSKKRNPSNYVPSKCPSTWSKFKTIPL